MTAEASHRSLSPGRRSNTDSAVDPAAAMVHGARPAAPRRFRLPIAAVLTIGFGGLMLVAVASVLLMGLITTGRNTTELLTQQARLTMGGLETRIRNQLDPARAQVEFMADLMVSGTLDPTDEAELVRHLRTALAAAPQITGVGFLSPENDFVVATRLGPRQVKMDVERGVHWGPEVLTLGRLLGGPVWIDPFWADDLKTGVLTVQMPVRRDGRFLGMLMTGVSLKELSRFLGDLQAETGLSTAILFDNLYVLAHPALGDREFDFSGIDERVRPPLPTLEELGDPVLGAIWQQVGPDGLTTGLGDEPAGTVAQIQIAPDIPPTELAFRDSEVGREEYLYLTRHLTDYGEHPWTLAIALNEAEVSAEFRRIELMAGTGFLILIVSVVLALWLGRRISSQIKRMASAAVAVRELDFAAIPTLPDSRFREMADASSAFNTMVAGLRWFETYVPKALVLRLINREDGPGGIVLSEEREVTVMFTDVRGFSTLAQSLSPQQTADWLNAHFTSIAACIEAEGGTVDKFIGDAVMAFWGAPDSQPDHAARALRAARAIEAQIRREAEETKALGGSGVVCLRVGIHSGPVVVGNIGAASRINYTIVGDTVNTAARLEALGSSMLGEDCCVTLASAETITAAGAEAGPVEALGDFTLRGRTGAVEVYRLMPTAQV
ncbi:MAG: adenylate cyclase 2 [Pseudomonadota bacterium]|jgi:adenylate cyclase